MITKRIDVEALPPVIGTLYPSPLDEPCRTRHRTRIGNRNGHHLQNRSSEDATFLEIGTRVAGDAATYPDVDLLSPPHQQPALYTHRDGTPYPKRERSGPGTT